MGIKELLIKIKAEEKETRESIAYLEKQIKLKECDPKIFMANTQWERFEIRKLREKLI